MFQCDNCHTEYGGIRGLPAGTCPRCREREAAPASPGADPGPFVSSFPARFAIATQSVAPRPLIGEIARLDRAVRC
jgi:hypothetical protein